MERRVTIIDWRGEPQETMTISSATTILLKKMHVPTLLQNQNTLHKPHSFMSGGQTSGFTMQKMYSWKVYVPTETIFAKENFPACMIKNKI